MALQFVKSQKGHDLLLSKGFLHRKERVIGEKVIWKCVIHHQNKCPGRVHTLDDKVVKFSSHNHVADIAKVEAKEALNEMKILARSVEITTQAVIANVSQTVSCATAGQLPSIPCIKRTILRTRQRNEAVPPMPKTLVELVIPEEYKKDKFGEPFLLFDSGSEEQRILIFSTRKNLEYMQRCEHWYADGTFKTNPVLFSQMYTIHAVQYSNVIPTVYALLPNKTEETYNRLFSALKNLQPGLQPTSVLVDFEKAAMNALQAQFPNARIRGCFFHFTQCLWRQIQNHGLQSRYSTDPTFALQLRKLSALAFVPEEDVEAAFQELMDSQFFTENEELLLPIMNYFEDTWIGRVDRRMRRRSAIYPKNIWNLYSTQNLPRTNNAVEGWHNSFSSILNAVHPNIWKVIQALKKENDLNKVKIEQYIAGHLPPQKKIYKDTSKRIQTIISDYGNRPVLDYLQGIAHNFQLQL